MTTPRLPPRLGQRRSTSTAVACTLWCVAHLWACNAGQAVGAKITDAAPDVGATVGTGTTSAVEPLPGSRS